MPSTSLSDLQSFFLTNIKYLEDIRFRLVTANFINKITNLKVGENDVLNLVNSLTKNNIIGTKTLRKIKSAWLKLEKGYPTDYILKEIRFKNFKIILEKGIFIPRPETEFGLENTVKKYKDKLPRNIVDLCAGSGFISIYLSKNLEDKNILSLDISDKAIKTIQKNANLNNIKNIKVLRSNGLEALESESLKNSFIEIFKNEPWALFCNPPYVPKEFEESVKFEPKRAIYSGRDGLNFFRRLVKDLEKLENPPIFMWFELDPRNIQKAKKILENHTYKQNLKTAGKKIGYSTPKIIKDQFGLERFLVLDSTV